jgi:hypothetical protein
MLRQKKKKTQQNPPQQNPNTEMKNAPGSAAPHLRLLMLKEN